MSIMDYIREQNVSGVRCMSKPNRKYLETGFIVAFISFALLFVGIKFILGNEIATKNMIASAGFSVLAGITASLLMSYGFKIAYTCFIVGLTVGFILMYRVFLQSESGWKDLIGLVSMFAFTLVSLIIGALAQLGYHLFKKYDL